MSLRPLSLGRLVTLAALALLIFGAASASAFQTHVFSASFGSAGSGAGQVSSPSGVAVNATTHDIYVADTANFRVDQFSSAGAFIRAWGWGVADGLPALETCTLSCQAGLSGSGVGQFTTPTFIAVDNSAGASAGDVYVGDTGTNQVQKFDAAGSLTTAWGSGGQLDGSTATDGPFGALAGIAIDTTGNLNVFDTNTRLFRFAQDGTFTTDFTTARGTSALGLGVDDSGNFFKVNGSPSVEKFLSDGTDVGQVSGGDSFATGIAVDPSSGSLYLDNQGLSVQRFAFDGSGGVVGTGCTPAPDGGCPATDSFGDGHLTAATALAADASDHTIYAADPGADQIVAFAASVIPDVTTDPATAPQKTTATLNGHLDPAGGGDISDCHFDYTNDATFQSQGYTGASTVACDQATPISSPAAVTAGPTGLTNATTYHFRLVAVDAQGTNRGADQTFTTSPPLDLTIAPAAPVGTTTATLNGHVDSSGGGDISDCHFDYTDDASFQANGFTGALTAPCSQASPISSPTDVSADLTGLAPGTDYHARLVATNGDGTTHTADQPFRTTGPAIGDEWSSEVGVTDAILNARINPKDSSTTYHFDYGTDTSYGQSAPASDATLGSGSQDLIATQLIAALSPATTYHYRVVSTNATGTSEGPDRFFTTRPTTSAASDTCPNAALRTTYAAYLPDCRAYEQVSPTDKNGGEAGVIVQGAEHDISRVAASGDGLAWASFANALAGSAGAQTQNTMLSRRGTTGWTTNDITPPMKFPRALISAPWFLLAFTDELDKGLTDTGPYPNLSPDATGGQNNIYLSDLSDPAHPSYQVVTPAIPNGRFAVLGGTSADLTHIVFSAPEALTPNAVPGGADNIYERVGGQLRLVNVDPSGTPIPAGNGAGGTGPYGGSSPRVVSTDGSRIFWEGLDGNLYVRENATTTTQLDASQGAGPGGGGSFYTASPDGSMVIFRAPASSALTSDTVPGSGPNLYRYDLNTGTLTDLTPAPDVQLIGFSGSSDDTSYAYFVANGDLDGAGPATPGDCDNANHGTCNLYLSHAGTTTFIARLGASDAQDWQVFDNQGGGAPTGPVVTTPDGTHFAFQSQGSLTGYDNTPATGPACGRDSDGQQFLGRCPEVYLYDATSNHLSCPSCNPTGGRPRGPSTLQIGHEGDFVGTLQHRPRDIADDGTVFFQSFDRLVSRDTNASQDVYEWAGGQAKLVSSGTSSDNAIFLDATPDGSGLFFLTRDRLAGQDVDQSFDIYDARVDGGLASQSPPPAVSCSGESCKGAPVGPPLPENAATVTFTGPGNAAPATVKAVPKVKVTHTMVSGSRFVLTVRAPGKGSITISGAGIRTIHKSFAKAGSYKVAVTLSAAGKRTLKRRHRLKLSARVGYAPAQGTASSATVALTLKNGASK
ncbi:hypothetical protein [Baekduia sp.]|uniref:hypothetical protein n=1 Tax=Baekduia sp. TaxID=2600305 RepID=UPI002DF8B9B9|nr:hypothetical protein [Baekduia sp.]